MLTDRSYMRTDYARRPTSALTWILSALIAGFVLQFAFGRLLGNHALEELLALTPGNLKQGHIWSLASYVLLHDGILHLLFNGLGIYLLGSELVPLVGSRRFLAVFVSAALLGGLAWSAAHYFTGGTSLVGATGCAMALFVLFACFYPDREFPFLLFFVLPVTLKPKHVAWAMVATSLAGLLFSELPGGTFGGSIAFSSHLGGMLAGWGYFRFFHANNGWDRAPTLGLPSWFGRRRAPPVLAGVVKHSPGRSPSELRAEADRILDKINTDGFGALTAEEKQTLDAAKDLLGHS